MNKQTNKQKIHSHKLQINKKSAQNSTKSFNLLTCMLNMVQSCLPTKISTSSFYVLNHCTQHINSKHYKKQQSNYVKPTSPPRQGFRLRRAEQSQQPAPGPDYPILTWLRMIQKYMQLSSVCLIEDIELNLFLYQQNE